MMFGYGDAWWALLVVPVFLWIPLGPLVMAGLGVRCALRPGRWPRLCSVLLPLLPVTVSAVLVSLPLDSWSRPGHTRDVLHYALVYIGALTVLPWLLGHGITRLTRTLRARRDRAVAVPAEAPDKP
ncbi:hypothetical protein ACFVG1_35320 [Streptomyces bacillaris]|uniref:hypothetical protein n=1 Tax=Streptomyces bacillaris TaxID=68179 RepID=UPI0035DA6E19